MCGRFEIQAAVFCECYRPLVSNGKYRQKNQKKTYSARYIRINQLDGEQPERKCEFRCIRCLYFSRFLLLSLPFVFTVLTSFGSTRHEVRPSSSIILRCLVRWAKIRFYIVESSTKSPSWVRTWPFLWWNNPPWLTTWLQFDTIIYLQVHV